MECGGDVIDVQEDGSQRLRAFLAQLQSGAWIRS